MAAMTNAQNETRCPSRVETLILMLMGIVILLMVAIAGLFIRMTQLQREVLAALAPFPMTQAEGLEIGTPAPDFQIMDTEGQMVSLADMARGSVLLAFSSTQCPACREMYPHLKTLGQRKSDLQVIMISHGTIEENRQLVSEQEFDFPVLVWEDTVARDYQVPGTPFFYVVEKATIVNTGFANSLEQLEALIEADNDRER